MNREDICYLNDRSNYVPLKNFGTALAPALRTDPIAYSIYKDIDSLFDEGSMARSFGPASKSSQCYMAEHCSKKWDGACELLSRNDDLSKPNVGLVESPAFRHNAPGTMSIGDYLVLNSATRRFCNFDSCSTTEEIYNPNDPTSPMVKHIGSDSARPCMPVCKVPENPNDDILLNKVLNQPHKYLDLLTNMYYHCRNDKTIQSDTRIAQIFKLFDAYFARQK